jgi:carboxymethylenebutenolidase
MADPALPYFLARPSTTPPWPGVVVVHEGNGMSTQLLRVCERLAREGYAAIAPDLFWRFGGSDPDKAGEHFTSLRWHDARADLFEAVGLLRAAGAAKVGITGFCMGGRLTYLAATDGVDVDCAAPFYGAGIAQALGEPSCPILLFFGGTDEWIPGADIEAVARHHGDRVVVYEQAGHGFMRDGSESYDEAAATDAWPKLLAFFAQHLTP